MELNKIHFSQYLPVSFEEEIQVLFFFHTYYTKYRKIKSNKHCSFRFEKDINKIKNKHAS